MHLSSLHSTQGESPLCCCFFCPQSSQKGSESGWIWPTETTRLISGWILYVTVSLNHHVFLTAVLSESFYLLQIPKERSNKTVQIPQEISNNCTCNAGKDFADSYQHILRHLPPYGQICCIVDNVAKHLVNGTVWFDDLQAFGLQNTWGDRHRKQFT